MTAPLQELLKQTSRSFYLTLRVLPARVRPQIGLAYLLARTTDTIADTEILPVEQRLDALQKLRDRILGQTSTPLHFGELARQQGAPAERALLEKVEDSLAQLPALSAADLKLVREVLATITSGQELDLHRFGRVIQSTSALTPALSPGEREKVADTSVNPTASVSSQHGNEKPPLLGERAGERADYITKIIALETAAELDDYTYRVAGCVGEFWTKICRAHLFPHARLDQTQLIADGIRFGKGLQLVNILRDLPADLKNGRCYLPAQKLAEAKLIPETLLASINTTKFLPFYHGYLDKAEAHLAAGWRYTNALPFGQVRVRLACAWPVLLGMKTITKLRAASVPDLQQRVKVSRAEVRGILLWSLASYPLPGVWRNQFPAGRKAVASGTKLS